MKWGTILSQNLLDRGSRLQLNEYANTLVFAYCEQTITPCPVMTLMVVTHNLRCGKRVRRWPS